MRVTREERLKRSALLMGDERMARLGNAHVMLFGLGGVGSYAAEALVRAGIGHLTIVDNDRVAASNLNRQLPALVSTVGKLKTEVVKERLIDIAPDCEITAINAFYLPDAPVEIPADCDFVADAIDTVSAKLHIAEVCNGRALPIIACMGMGNRLDPTQIRIGDLFETNNCPLCRVMRRELRKRGIEALPSVYSTEAAIKPIENQGSETKATGRTAPGSVSYLPSVAGLYMAHYIVKRLTE